MPRTELELAPFLKVPSDFFLKMGYKYRTHAHPKVNKYIILKCMYFLSTIIIILPLVTVTVNLVIELILFSSILPSFFFFFFGRILAPATQKFLLLVYGYSMVVNNQVLFCLLNYSHWSVNLWKIHLALNIILVEIYWIRLHWIIIFSTDRC